MDGEVGREGAMAAWRKEGGAIKKKSSRFAERSPGANLLGGAFVTLLL